MSFSKITMYVLLLSGVFANCYIDKPINSDEEQILNIEPGSVSHYSQNINISVSEREEEAREFLYSRHSQDPDKIKFFEGLWKYHYTQTGRSFFDTINGGPDEETLGQYILLNGSMLK